MLPKKLRTVETSLFYKWHADLHGFANICKLPVAHAIKVMQSKIC